MVLRLESGRTPLLLVVSVIPLERIKNEIELYVSLHDNGTKIRTGSGLNTSLYIALLLHSPVGQRM